MSALEVFTYEHRMVTELGVEGAHKPELPASLRKHRELCDEDVCLCNRCRKWRLLEDEQENAFRQLWRALHPEGSGPFGYLRDDAFVIWLALWGILRRQTDALESLIHIVVARGPQPSVMGGTLPITFLVKKELVHYATAIVKEASA